MNGGTFSGPADALTPVAVLGAVFDTDIAAVAVRVGDERAFAGPDRCLS